MKVLVFILGIIILGLGVLYLNQSSTEVESDTENQAFENNSANTGNLSDEETPTMGMPAEGNEVDEMVVTDIEGTSEGVVIEISGFNYGYSQDEIRVKEGDTVTINFVSDDGFHDWVVDEFDAATEKVRPGTPTSVTFVADTAGTYEYYCSVGSHRAQGMVGTLIVE